MTRMKVIDDGVILDPIPGSGLVSVCLAFPAPEAVEEPGSFGFAGLVMELLRVGGGTIPEKEISARFDGWGGGLSAFCTDVGCGLRYSCLPEVLNDSLKLLRGLIDRICVSESLFDRERQARMALIREEREDPASECLLRARMNYFGISSLGYSALGSTDDLQAASVDQLHRFSQTILRKKGCVLSISGDFCPSTVIDLADEWRWDSEACAGVPTILRHGEEPSCEEIIRHPKEQTVVANLFGTSGTLGKDALIRSLVLSCLNGLSGPLFEEIRERHGLAYYSSARFLGGMERGMIAFLSGCEESQVTFLTDRLSEILRRLMVRGFSQGEVEGGRAQMRSGFLMSRQKSGWRALRLALRQIQGLPIDLGESAEDFLRMVRREELRDWCARTLDPSDGITLRMLPET